jgi:hypothetical protein
MPKPGHNSTFDGNEKSTDPRTFRFKNQVIEKDLGADKRKIAKRL